MEVLDKGKKKNLLTNRDVFELLTDIQEGRNGFEKPLPSQHNLSNVVYTTLAYLKDTPCRHQSQDINRRFCEAAKGFGLTKAEKLQLLNLRPTTDAEIQVTVEECEARLNVEQVNDLLQVIADVLPTEPSSPGEDGAAEDDQDEEVDDDEEALNVQGTS